jgi:hypothetical protein
MLLVKKSMKNYLRVEICTQPGTGTTQHPVFSKKTSGPIEAFNVNKTLSIDEKKRWKNVCEPA